MNPLAALAALFATLTNDIRTRFNAAISKLPPLEQIEGGNAVLNVINSIDWARERMDQCVADLESALTAATAKVEGFEKRAGETATELAARLWDGSHAAAAAAALTAAIAARTVLPIEEHTTLIDAATRKGAADAEVAFNARLADIATLAARRAEATEKLGQVAANALKDADLLGENYAELLAAMEGRIASLAAAGITPEARPLGYASLVAEPLDETGTADFNARLATLKEAAAPITAAPITAVPITAAAPAKPTPSTPATTIPTETASKKTII